MVAENTKIEWADHTFNPWIGCQKVSPACDHCYAETLMDTRLGQVEWGPGKPRKRTAAANWRKPYKWNREAEKNGTPARVFCASLADVFDNAVPDSWRTDLWRLIYETPNLIWMLLTKRPQNIAKMLPNAVAEREIRERRIWLGTTAENQEEADRRIPDLLANRAAVHFISAEPLLGPVDLAEYMPMPAPLNLASTYVDGDGVERLDLTGERIVGLGWVIVGGESGPNARPMHPHWATSIRDQCVAAGIPFFHKQWGEWAPGTVILDAEGALDGRLPHHDWGDDRVSYRIGKKRAGRRLDGRTWDGMPA